MRYKNLSTLGAVCLLLGGCASMTFYPDAEMKKPKEGLKFYYTKPYLLVARDGTAKVTSITVQYLPDLEHPVYAKATPGYGSSNLTLAFSNGVITNFGQQVDTKVPETISSLGSLIPGYGSAVKALTDASVERRQADVEQQASDLPKDAQALKTIADGLRDVAASGSFATVDVVAMRTIADELYVAPAGVTQRPESRPEWRHLGRLQLSIS